MIEDNIFLTDQTSESNLTEISFEGSLTEERRICEVSEIVDEAVAETVTLLTDGMTLSEALSIIGEGISFGESVPHDGAMTENLPVLRTYRILVSALDRAAFSRLYAERLTATVGGIGEADFLPKLTPPETLAYVKNPYADEAYDVFSVELSDPRVTYAPSFKELARMLSKDEVGYVLLPLEERGGVRLPTVAEIILRDDFKINSVTPVFGLDGGADMKYALVSKSFTASATAPGDDSYLEIRIELPSSTLLSELLCVSESLGARLYRVNTVTLDTDDGERTYYSVVLCDDGSGFISLLVYLTLFTPDLIPVGMYKNLE